MTPEQLSFIAYQRAAWNTFETTVRALMAGGLTSAGLLTVVRDLKYGFWRPSPGDPMPADVVTRRALLLNDACTAAAAAAGMDTGWPFPADLLPTVPDDARTVDDGECQPPVS